MRRAVVVLLLIAAGCLGVVWLLPTPPGWRLVRVPIDGQELATLLGVGTELSLGTDESDLVRAIRQSTQQNVAQAGQRITEKNLNIQPTITIRPGWPLKVIVQRDIVLRAYPG